MTGNICMKQWCNFAETIVGQLLTLLYMYRSFTLNCDPKESFHSIRLRCSPVTRDNIPSSAECPF